MARRRAPPSLDDYDIEPEVPGRLRWGDDVEIDAAATVGLREVDGDNQIVGRANECDAAGVLSLDIGGSIVMLELANRPSADLAGAIVSVRVQRLEIHPAEF